MRKLYKIAVVGATGLIGRKLIKVLEKRNFPAKEITLFASEKSVGRCIYALGKHRPVKTLNENAFNGLDIVFFCAGSDISKTYTPIAIKCGAFVIDNSSAFRKIDEIPLIIPEINGNILKNYNGKIISNPNCSTAISVLPLKTLDDNFGIKRIIYTSFQAVSGSGNKGIRDLKRCLNGNKPQFYPVNICKNCLPQIGNFSIFGYTEEELKMVDETRKILGKQIPISATCVRVPIENCHGVSISVELEKPYLDEEIRGIFATTKGITISDIPLCENANNKDEVLVGRIKRSFAFENGVDFYCVGDNTLKGATLNAVQIAEKLISFNKI